MNERLRLHGIGLYFSQCPMVGQTLEIVEHYMRLGVGKAQHLYENVVACRIGIQFHIVIMLPQAETTQCPGHKVILWVRPPEAVLQRVLSRCPEGLNNSHRWLQLIIIHYKSTSAKKT